MAEPQTTAPRIPAPAPEPGATDAPTPTARVADQVGWIAEEGAFVLPLGAGVKLATEDLGQGGAQTDIRLPAIPAIPGLAVTSARFHHRAHRVDLAGTTAIPLLRDTPFALRFDARGRPSRFSVRTRLEIGWLDNPALRLSWTPDGGVSTEVTINAAQFVPAALRRRAETEGDVTLGLSAGKLSGAINTKVTVPDVLEAQFNGGFGADGLAASIALTNKAEWLGELSGQGQVDGAGRISAQLSKTATEMTSPIGGVRFLGGALSVGWAQEGGFTGSVTDLRMQYGSFAQSTLSLSLERGQYAGSGSLDVAVPGLSEASGTLAMQRGRLSGSLSIGRDSFPEGLPLERGAITGRVSETGALSFSGRVGIRLGPAGRGELEASYAEDGGFSIGAQVDLSVPGLQQAQFSIAYDGTDITGSGEAAVDPQYLAGVDGRVAITYAEGRWAGETTLGYSADNGKLSGTVTVRVRQAEDDSLKVGGEGDVTAQLAPRLSGTLRATILEEGGVDVSGEISVTEPLELFPEQRFEKELLDVSKNIPLWAILVAVLRVRAGVRAGIGPGVFRDIRVTGSYSIGKEGEPSFDITGEMYIPAFVEGYVGFGAGLGASVVLGSLTGGIEAMGTAGLYGAISVVPTLAYKDGDYSIEGIATMAAGARLKLSLNAWAEVEALWVTVWENSWELASVTMPLGPDLGLQAKMAYTFGAPTPPSLEFSSSGVDTSKLIQDAMPKDGPPRAGVRDQVKNEAKWQGAQRRAGREANAVPAAQAARGRGAGPVARPSGGRAPDGPGAAPRAGRGRPGHAGAARQRSAPVAPGAGRQPGARGDDARRGQARADAAAARDPSASGTVPAAQAASTRAPRHGRVSPAMLREPPVAMPRSKAQQAADVSAAAELVRQLAQAGDSTDRLDAHFPAIKARFRLRQIGYVVDGGGLKVRLKVNDEAFVPVQEEDVQNLPSGILGPGLATRVRYETLGAEYVLGGASAGRKVRQATMGHKMIAAPLTPYHAQGGGPKSGSLGAVFGVVPTMGSTGSEGYIRGHLLNDNLGGPGEDKNLFPITQTANSRHNSEIEADAKTLVNDRHYHVHYSVEMRRDSWQAYTDHAGVDRVSINSTIIASLAVLKSDLRSTRHVKTVRIPSRFNLPAAQPQTDALRNATRRQLEDPAAHGQSFTAAEGRAERTRREQVSQAFLAQQANQVRRDTDENLLADLTAGRATGVHRQAGVDQSRVRLSSAHRRSAQQALELTPLAHAQLVRLAGAGALSARPFAGAASLGQRLADTAIGTSDHTTLRAAAMAVRGLGVRAGRADLAGEARVSGAQKAALRQYNSDSNGARLRSVLDRFTSERLIAARLARRSGRLTKADMEVFASVLTPARQTERVAFAALVAASYGTRTQARDALRAMGVWESSAPFYTSLRTKVLALPAGS